MPNPVHTSYLREVLCPRTLPRTLRSVRKAIVASGLQFDAIAFRGMSGALIAPIIAARMRKGLIVCRKPDENSHAGAGYEAEGYLCGGNYIIIDDFYDTGTTLRYIMNTIDQVRLAYNEGFIWDEKEDKMRKRRDEERVPKFVCVGMFFYRRNINNHWDAWDRSIPTFGCRPPLRIKE